MLAPYGSRSLAGPATDPISDAVANAITQAMTGGAPGSPERTDRTEFLSDVFDKSLEKYSASEVGQQTISGAIAKAVVPVTALSVAAFFIGYLIGKRGGRG